MKMKEVDCCYWLVRRLPKKLIYFCFLHIMVHSTTGGYSSTNVPELTGMEASDRYGKDNGII